MRKTSRFLVLGFSALLLISLVVPVSLGSSITQAQEPAPKPVTINGTVSTVSETSLTVMDTQKVEQTIAIDANTKITKGGKAAAATDIKANDSVVVVAQKGEGTALTAVSIKVG
jgi:Domain of unknown function (DUF5666)